MLQGASLLGPCTAKLAEDSDRSSDERGVFIEVEQGTQLPQGFGTVTRYIVERDFRPAEVLTENGRVLRYRDRQAANEKMQSL